MQTRRDVLRLSAAAAAVAVTRPGVAETRGPVVFAAASLKNALDDINARWQKRAGKRATISYGASSALAKQIEQGAPADIFISADLDWMDYLAARKLIKQDTRSNLLANELVLIAPKGTQVKVNVEPGFPLASLIEQGRLAMANTDAVPAGKYGKAALEALGVWDSVKDRVAQADNVRAALLLVSRGEAPFGIVYRTDAASDSRVMVVGTFPENTHPPIVYPVAMTEDSSSPDAAAFLAEIKSPEARALFEAQGFTPL